MVGSVLVFRNKALNTMKFLFSLIFLSGIISLSYGIDPTPLPAKLPDSILECYNETDYFIKDKLLPMTMTTLISLISKAEDALPNMNIRTLTPALLHRFRFDGIKRNPNVELQPYVIPYSPAGHEFFLYRVLFQTLIPNQNYFIPNDTFTRMERCTLHWMLSSSIDPWLRDEGDDVCNKLNNKIQVNERVPRSVEEAEDTEVFDPESGPAEDVGQAGNYQHVNQDLEHDLSACPIENGVIFHKYGAVNPGILLAGISAGLQPQTVTTKNLIAAQPQSRRRQRPSPGINRQIYGANNQVSNIWAGTLSGLLAEMALLQGPKNQQMQITDGGWNSTTIPKYYFLTENQHDSLTTSRIRGALDGLIIAKNIVNWYQAANNLKLSQLLTMYYSDSGVFDNEKRACNRRGLVPTVAPQEDITDQTHSFALVLQDELPVSVSLKDEAVQDYATTAASSLMTYLPTMQDLTCPSSLTQYGGSTSGLTQNPIVDLHIVLDCSMDFKQISPIIFYLLNELHTYPGSNISVINGKDGSVMIDSETSFTNFIVMFNESYYKSVASGFDMRIAMNKLQYRFLNKSDWDQVSANSAGGMPEIVLFIPSPTATINDGDKSNIDDKFNSFKERIPDVYFLYLIPGSKDRFTPFAESPKDIFPLVISSDDSQIPTYIKPLVDRLSLVPKRVINPTCGRSWSGTSYNSLNLNGYLTPNEIHYYRVATNYFYNANSAKIDIQGDGKTTLNVCQSRYNINPYGNSTANKTDFCKQVLSSGSFAINLNSLCSDASYASECNPLYFSVYASPSSIPTMNSCPSSDCPFPNDIKYTITHQGLVCYSGVANIIFSPYMFIMLAVLHLLQH